MYSVLCNKNVKIKVDFLQVVNIFIFNYLFINYLYSLLQQMYWTYDKPDRFRLANKLIIANKDLWIWTLNSLTDWKTRRRSSRCLTPNNWTYINESSWSQTLIMIVVRWWPLHKMTIFHKFTWCILWPFVGFSFDTKFVSFLRLFFYSS